MATQNRGQTARRPSPATGLHQWEADESDGALNWIKDRFFSGQSAHEATELKRLERAQADLKGVNDAGAEDGLGEVVDEDLGTARKVTPATLKRPDVAALVSCLQDWLNDRLWQRRIVVRNIFDDLYDGQVLTEFLEVLTGESRQLSEREQREFDIAASGSNLASVRQEAIHQRRGRLQLQQVLEWIDSLLGITRSANFEDELQAKWTTERIWSKDIVATLHLMVALARHFGCNHPLPDNVVVEVVLVERQRDRMRRSTTAETITAEERSALQARACCQSSAAPSSSERDALDKLFDQAPKKVEAVKNSLLNFVNKHMSKISWFKPLDEIGLNFDDGVLLIHLLSVLGGYFVPLYEYRTAIPGYGRQLTDLQKVGNVGLVFRLMIQDGMEAKGVPDDLVNGDVKSTLRTLYYIFSRYKQVTVATVI